MLFGMSLVCKPLLSCAIKPEIDHRSSLSEHECELNSFFMYPISVKLIIAVITYLFCNFNLVLIPALQYGVRRHVNSLPTHPLTYTIYYDLPKTII